MGVGGGKEVRLGCYGMGRFGGLYILYTKGLPWIPGSGVHCLRRMLVSHGGVLLRCALGKGWVRHVIFAAGGVGP